MAPDSPLMAKARVALSTVFGFSDFRPGQEDILAATFVGEDVLAVMPTGSGKSLCFQLPAIVRGGLTLVVSPLIALMRDQVAQLREAGVEAASLNSSSDPDERRRVARGLDERSLRLLYIAPERLMRDDTVAALSKARVDCLAIDEAHCVSQWGHDFRPEYLRLREVAEALHGVQTIAVTATADKADAGRNRRKAVRPFPTRFRALVRSPEPVSGDAAESERQPAAHRPARSSSRRSGHHLLRVAAPDRGARGRIGQRRPARPLLSRRAQSWGSRPQSGRLPARGRLRRLRDRRLRHGDRQARRPLRLSRRHALVDRSLLSGDRPRRPRRPARGHVHALRRGRHRVQASSDSRQQRARGAQAGRDDEARRPCRALRDGPVPPADAAWHVRNRPRAGIATSARGRFG